MESKDADNCIHYFLCFFLSGVWQGCVDRLSLNEGKLIKTQPNACEMNC